MADEINRRSFFPAMAFSPLALLGLQKKSDKTDLRVKRMYDTKEFYRKRFDDLIKLLQTADESADYWECRAVAAEKKLEQDETCYVGECFYSHTGNDGCRHFKIEWKKV